jgi:membrane associated rhomboid family serine protease
MLALQIIGKHIQSKYGSRYVWGLYLAGALAGSLSMSYFMPYDTIPIPKVGADPCISAFLSFVAVQNPSLTLFQFVLPFKFWMLIAGAALFFVFTDSSCKNLGGLAMGVGLGLLRKRFLL